MIQALTTLSSPRPPFKGADAAMRSSLILYLVARASDALVAPPKLAGARPRAHKRAPRRDVSRMALRLDLPLLRVGQSAWDVVGTTAVVVGGAAACATAVVVGYTAVSLVAPALGRAAGGAAAGSGPEWLKLRAGQVRATADALKLAWSDLFEDESLVVLEDTWAPCVLEATEDFGDDGAGGAAYTAYRFALKQGGKAVLPLELGQEVTFVGLDGRNRPVRASFPLASNRRDAGAVEVVVAAPGRRRAREAVGGLTAEQRAVVDAFDGLGIGGEAAVRPGRRAFTYEGSYLPITSLQCFAEELGALPVIQLLKESLPRGRSTIAKAQVFWINEGEDDFGLYEGLETLFYKFPKKMELACVVDDKLHSPDTTKNAPGDAVFRRNDDLAGAVAPWQPGMLAVVAGPDAFQDQVVAHLTGAKGYPPECIVYF